MNESRQQALPVGTRIGVYEIRRVIGVGRFGITYQVWNQHLNAEMALKEYFPSDIVQRAADGLTVLQRSENEESLFQLGLDRFSEDADKLARIEHPHLQQVQNDLQIHGTVYLVMEYEDGIPLSRLIERSGAVLEEEQIKVIFLPIFEALEKVHEAGVLHGDINPANIFLRKSGESVLLDFASARLALAAPLGISLEVFSEGYTPAEQYDPQGQPGPCSDLYAIGATLYRCVTGNEPLSATDRFADVSKGNPDPQWPAIEAAAAGYHEEFLKVIDWMLSIRPEDRPQSVAPLLESFKIQSEEEAEADGKSSQQSGPAVADAEQNASRRVRLPVSLLIFVAIASVLLIGTVFWYSGSDRRADEILAAAESHRLATLGLSEDKTMAQESASTVDLEAARELDESEWGSYERTPEAEISRSEPQAQGMDSLQATDDPFSDVLTVRDESSMENPYPAFETVETTLGTGDPKRQADTADTEVELVELFEGLRSEGKLGVAGGEWYRAESVPESLPTPMDPVAQALKDTDAITRPESSANIAAQSHLKGSGPEPFAMRAPEEAQIESSLVQEDTLSERELTDSSSPDLTQGGGRPAAPLSESFILESHPAFDETESEFQTAQIAPTEGSITASQNDTDPGLVKANEPNTEEPAISETTTPEPSQVTEMNSRNESDGLKKTAPEMMALLHDESSVSRIEASTLPSRDRIARHMAAAEEDMQALRLSTPQGDNALEHYQAVLTLDSGHNAAQEGVRHIVEVYSWLIDRAIEQDQLVAARVYLQRAEEIMPEAPELQQARLDLSTVQPALETESLEEAE